MNTKLDGIRRLVEEAKAYDERCAGDHAYMNLGCWIRAAALDVACTSVDDQHAEHGAVERMKNALHPNIMLELLDRLEFAEREVAHLRERVIDLEDEVRGLT